MQGKDHAGGACGVQRGQAGDCGGRTRPGTWAPNGNPPGLRLVLLKATRRVLLLSLHPAGVSIWIRSLKNSHPSSSANDFAGDAAARVEGRRVVGLGHPQARGGAHRCHLGLPRPSPGGRGPSVPTAWTGLAPGGLSMRRLQAPGGSRVGTRGLSGRGGSASSWLLHFIYYLCRL